MMTQMKMFNSTPNENVPRKHERSSDLIVSAILQQPVSETKRQGEKLKGRLRRPPLAMNSTLHTSPERDDRVVIIEVRI